MDPTSPRSSDATWEEAVRVLLVEDDEDFAEATRRLLVRYGARVEVASSAADAMERVAGVRPELVITDLRLPDLDGFGLIARLRAPMAEFFPLFVVVSGSASRRAGSCRGSRTCGQQFHAACAGLTMVGIRPTIQLHAKCDMGAMRELKLDDAPDRK